MQWSKSSRSFLVVLLKRSFSTFVNEIVYLFCCICSGVVGQCVGWSFWRLRDSRPVRQYHMHFSSRDWAVSDWSHHWTQNLTLICFMTVSKRKGLTLVKLQSNPNLRIWRPNEANYRGPFHIQSSILHLLLLNFLYIQVGLISQLKCKLKSVFRNIQCKFLQ